MDRLLWDALYLISIMLSAGRRRDSNSVITALVSCTKLYPARQNQPRLRKRQIYPCMVLGFVAIFQLQFIRTHLNALTSYILVVA